MTVATPLLIPGNMCDARLWTSRVRAVLPGAVDVDTTGGDTIEGMAARALAIAPGPLLPVGFSMGGIIALEMARQAPERIAAMVLLDTNAAADLPERAAARPRQQAAVQAGALERVVVEELKPNYLAADNRGDAALLALLRDMALALGPTVFVHQSEALRTRPDLRDVLPMLDVPLLVACGAEDALCPPSWHERWARMAPQATLEVCPGAGHMLPLEQPELVARAIDRWLPWRSTPS